MYLYTSIVRGTLKGEDLSQILESWSFCLIDNVLVLDSYIISVKEKGKRKYKIIKQYDRLYRRDSTLTIDEVPFPEDVQIDAKNDIMNQITVSKKLSRP
jgi:hypothetical protein